MAPFLWFPFWPFAPEFTLAPGLWSWSHPWCLAQLLAPGSDCSAHGPALAPPWPSRPWLLFSPGPASGLQLTQG